ncbi:MAG: outer membrane protein assembly factor BamC [Halioglobus sp.]|jgi:outer membrane protein assembly factor BamC
MGNSLVRILLVATVLSMSTACSYLFGDKGYFRDKSEDYKLSPEQPRLKLPDGTPDEALLDSYVVPPVNESLVLPGEFEVPRPTPLVAGGSDEIVRIQKLGDKRWALVSMAPGQLWPQVRGFVTAAGVQIARVDARSGLIETGWVDLDDADMDARFQFRIEQGVQRGNSELHVLQMNQAGDINSWPAQSDNTQLEADMLQGVAQYIANSADSAPVSMIAEQAISASGKISLQESSDGGAFIRVGLPYSRAWASLARALELSTFEITDRDRSEGHYYVNFIGPEAEDEDGWFDWLFDEEGHPSAGQSFLVKAVAENDETVSITIERQASDESDGPFDRRQEQALLALIKGNIN